MFIIVYLLCAVTSNTVLISFRLYRDAVYVYACARRSVQFQMLEYRCIRLRVCVCASRARELKVLS